MFVEMMIFFFSFLHVIFGRWAGFYRGFMPSLMLCSHGAILLVAYEPRRNPRKTDEDRWIVFKCFQWACILYCMYKNSTVLNHSYIFLHQFWFILRTVSRHALIQCLRHPVVQRSSRRWMLGTNQNGSDSKTHTWYHTWRNHVTTFLDAKKGKDSDWKGVLLNFFKSSTERSQTMRDNPVFICLCNCRNWELFVLTEGFLCFFSHFLAKPLADLIRFNWFGRWNTKATYPLQVVRSVMQQRPTNGPFERPGWVSLIQNFDFFHSCQYLPVSASFPFGFEVYECSTHGSTTVAAERTASLLQRPLMESMFGRHLCISVLPTFATI